MMPNGKKSELERLPNEVKYLKNEMKNLRFQLKDMHEKDTLLMEQIDSHFTGLFNGVEKELKLLRSTLVLVLLANMPNRHNRKSFLRMVDFVKKESDFQDFVDDIFGGLIDTKKLADIL